MITSILVQIRVGDIDNKVQCTFYTRDLRKIHEKERFWSVLKVEDQIALTFKTGFQFLIHQTNVLLSENPLLSLKSYFIMNTLFLVTKAV